MPSGVQKVRGHGKAHAQNVWRLKREVPPKPKPKAESWWAKHAHGPRSGDFYQEARAQQFADPKGSDGLNVTPH